MDAKTLEKIKDYAKKEYGVSSDRQHNFDHVDRVAKNALKIVDALDVADKIDKNLLQAACYLHDIATSKSKSSNYFSQFLNHIFEKNINKRNILGILANFDLTWDDSQILLASIINHSYSIPYRILNKQKDLYSQILQDADSLDYAISNREDSFLEGKGKISVFLVRMYMNWIRNNIEKYLNFPELAEKIVVN